MILSHDIEPLLSSPKSKRVHGWPRIDTASIHIKSANPKFTVLDVVTFISYLIWLNEQWGNCCATEIRVDRAADRWGGFLPGPHMQFVPEGLGREIIWRSMDNSLIVFATAY